MSSDYVTIYRHQDDYPRAASNSEFDVLAMYLEGDVQGSIKRCDSKALSGFLHD